MVDIAAPVKLRMVALMAPIAGYVLMWCVALSWAGSLPDPVAVQWGSAGVTNLNSLVSYYGFFAAGVVVPGGLGLLAAVTANRGTRRVCAGLAVMLSFVLGGMCIAIVAGQRHLPNASESSVPLASMGIVATIGIGLGVAAAYFVDGDAPGNSSTEESLDSRYRQQWRSATDASPPNSD